MLASLTFASRSHTLRCTPKRPAASRPAAVVLRHVAPRRLQPPQVARTSAGRSLTEIEVAELTGQLRALENERDEAVKTAESCARTAVRLEEMVQLLEQLALNKVADGDEGSARSVLQEKAAVREVLGRTQERAQTNYALAAKLAEKIGGLQRQLVDNLGTGRSTAQDNASTPLRSNSSYSSSITSSSRSAATSTSTGGSRTPVLAPWEVSLAEAQQRLRQSQEAAQAAGATAAAAARETIEEARARLRIQAEASVGAAQQRIHSQTSESLAAARARIAAQEAEALARVRGLMARYRSGGFVSDDELEWAFRVLERRAGGF